MKKFLCLLSLLIIPSVNARDLNIYNEVNPDYIFKIEGSETQREATIYKVEGAIAYTLNPEEPVRNFIENKEEPYLMSLTETQKNYIKKIYQNGYKDGDNFNYFMATQELIWEYMTGLNVYFVDRLGNTINLESEKNEILNKEIATKESFDFDDTIISGSYFEAVTLVDMNKMLNDYEIVNYTKNIISKTNYKLSVKIRENGSFLLRRKKEKEEIKVYHPTNSSRLVSFLDTYEGMSFDVTRNNNANAFLEFFFDVDESIDFTLNNETYKTDSKGYFKMPRPLDIGTYEVAIDSYLYQDKLLSFSFSEADIDTSQNVKVKFHLTKQTGSIKIQRKGKILEEVVAIPNVEYKVYAKEDILDDGKVIFKKDSFVTSGVTNDAGVLVLDKLPVGCYLVKEGDSNFVLTEPFTFEITNNLEDIQKEITTDHVPFHLDMEDTNLYEVILCDKDGNEIKKLEEENILNIEYGTYFIKVMKDNKLIYSSKVEFTKKKDEASISLEEVKTPILFDMPKTGRGILDMQKSYSLL